MKMLKIFDKYKTILGIFTICIIFAVSGGLAFKNWEEYNYYLKVNQKLEQELKIQKTNNQKIKDFIEKYKPKNIVRSNIEINAIVNNQRILSLYLDSLYDKNSYLFIKSFTFKKVCQKDFCFRVLKLSGEKIEFF
ncbi:hypothetical protein Thein_1883 [Thermodesulfatator indicus DSM 15286]|uniref:Uncharacterized protein n=1 Tax=Thermodesulfatator indicus (strain DSM 15286 / JCM 11887 / CIR29812) TaxID=667014 RepID=F8ACA3_THEID|nr:hypothetical protein [Thermodesulfatator indicus]AEH45738.1 hypothetical protein Thein_1883 [Thermodesulfatator indicus DSM 15286]